MADISSIVLPNGNNYNFKDSTLQTTISNLVDKSSWLSTASYSKDNIGLANYSQLDAPQTVQTTINVARSGYTAIGVVGAQISNASSSGVNCSWTHLESCWLSATTTVTARVNSMAKSNGAKVKVTVQVLYKKN